MLRTNDRFRGVRVDVNDIRGDPRTILVRFTPRKLEGAPSLGDAPKRAIREALVVVRAAQEVEVVGYIPPEEELPGLGQADYEQMALEEVRAQGFAQR